MPPSIDLAPPIKIDAEDGVTLGSRMTLKAGDQLAAVAGSSLVESADPFAKAIELISGHTQRPLTLHFIDGDRPGPYSVVYRAVSMGIGVGVAPAGPHGGEKGFPMVVKASTSPFPKVGDQLYRVNGHTVRNKKIKKYDDCNNQRQPTFSARMNYKQQQQQQLTFTSAGRHLLVAS